MKQVSQWGVSVKPSPGGRSKLASVVGVGYDTYAYGRSTDDPQA
jgi:hypothetical protein